eukprot:1961639-Pyramimonas_sp.AAC.1
MSVGPVALENRRSSCGIISRGREQRTTVSLFMAAGAPLGGPWSTRLGRYAKTSRYSAIRLTRGASAPIISLWCSIRRRIQEPLVVHENVWTFPAAELDNHLGDLYIVLRVPESDGVALPSQRGDARVVSERMDPSHLGLPRHPAVPWHAQARR